MRGPRLLTLAFALAIAFALAAIPMVRTQAAQQDDPVAGPDGGMLDAYDSGTEGFFTKTYVYDTGSEVVAFDAQLTPAVAEAAIGCLGEQTDTPISRLVVSPLNPDKFNGLSAF